MSFAKDTPAESLEGDRSAASDFSEKSFTTHQHSLSGSTFCSYESSPTTTCSLVDDSSCTDPSPGSSPESPPPLAAFRLGMLRPQSNDETRPSTFFELQQAAPLKKGRNLKNLAVNTSRKPPGLSALTSVPQQVQKDSIMSPGFVKPPTPPKRKPSNLGLTLLTPSGLSSNDSPQQIRLAIPATPGFGRPGTLRHFQSSPSLPLLTGLGHDVKNSRLAALDTIFSPLEQTSTFQLKELDEEQNYDVPLSREEKPEAYPDGPITIYAPYIDLYLEPTAAEAQRYDVVMNVASEVRNPFTEQPHSPDPEVRMDGGGGISYASKRNLAVNADQPNGSPTTPKATPLSQTFPKSEDVEYIHIPWEHNSDIVPDLLRLVKLIDERVEQNKRVLIHCQCGVSRSASLVVAYGLYKDPSLSVQEAYDAVKKKSKWIGPNMNLIMQLQEFRSSLAHGGVLALDRGLSPTTPASAMDEWRSPFSVYTSEIAPQGGSSSAGLLNGFSKSETSIPLAEPPSAPLTAGPRSVRPRAISAVKRTSAYVDPAGHLVPVVSIATTEIEPPSTIAESTESSTPTLTSPRSAEFAMSSLQPSLDVNPMDAFGLMSPTSTGFSSNPFDRSSLLAALGMTAHSQPTLPVRTRSLRSQEKADKSQGLAAPRTLRSRISSPSLQDQKRLQSFQAHIEAQLPQRQVIAAPTELSDALMSPRATTFTQNPFALAFDTAQTAPQEAPIADPRSPATKGASPIIRNIEDFL